MINTAQFNCYKISLQPNLNRLADFFKVELSGEDHSFLILKPDEVSSTLKFDTPTKFVWFFKFGCVCFVDFDTTETYRFLISLESIFGKIDFNLFSKFNENHNLEFNQSVSPEKIITTLSLYAIVLAKSTELKYLEAKLNSVYDRAERLVLDLQQGLPKPFNRVLKRFTLDIVKLQLTIVNDLKILERPNEYDDLKLKTIYHSTAELYELKKRFNTIQTKIANLIEIITPYQNLGFNRRETRLLIWEVIMIALFPLSRVLDHFLSKILTFFHFL